MMMIGRKVSSRLSQALPRVTCVVKVVPEELSAL